MFGKKKEKFIPHVEFTKMGFDRLKMEKLNAPIIIYSKDLGNKNFIEIENRYNEHNELISQKIDVSILNRNLEGVTLSELKSLNKFLKG